MAAIKNKSVYNWSGGKDSSLALYHVLRDPHYRVEKLLTSVNSKYNRISMHGVRVELLEEQARQLDIPLQQLVLPDQPSMTDYENIMSEHMNQLKNEGFTHSIFGDIFLEDLKQYRDDKLAQAGFTGHYPIWKRDTTELIHEFLDLGFKTILVCVKSELLGKEFAGRVIDKDFLKDLPSNVDPCGEKGEFHTFVFDGPIFKAPIPIEVGETIYREYKSPKEDEDTCDGASNGPDMGFWFTDLRLDSTRLSGNSESSQ